MQHFAISEISGGPNFNSNVNSGTETYAGNLMFI